MVSRDKFIAQRNTFFVNNSQFSDLSKVIIIFVEGFYSFPFSDNLVDFN